MRSIPESDLKKIRVLKDSALNIACERIFEKIDEIMDERKGKEHQAYLQLWQQDAGNYSQGSSGI